MTGRIARDGVDRPRYARRIDAQSRRLARKAVHDNHLRRIAAVADDQVVADNGQRTVVLRFESVFVVLQNLETEQAGNISRLARRHERRKIDCGLVGLANGPVLRNHHDVREFRQVDRAVPVHGPAFDRRPGRYGDRRRLQRSVDRRGGLVHGDRSGPVFRLRFLDRDDGIGHIG